MMVMLMMKVCEEGWRFPVAGSKKWPPGLRRRAVAGTVKCQMGRVSISGWSVDRVRWKLSRFAMMGSCMLEGVVMVKGGNERGSQNRSC